MINFSPLSHLPTLRFAKRKVTLFLWMTSVGSSSTMWDVKEISTLVSWIFFKWKYTFSIKGVNVSICFFYLCMYVYLYMYIQIHIYKYIYQCRWICWQCTRCLKQISSWPLFADCHCRFGESGSSFARRGTLSKFMPGVGDSVKVTNMPHPRKKGVLWKMKFPKIYEFSKKNGGEVLVLGRVDISCRVGYCMSLKCNNFWDTRIHSDNHHAGFVLRFSRKSLQFLSLMEVEKIQVVATQHLAIVCLRWLRLKAPHVHLEIWMVHVPEKETHVCSPFRWM